jgi:outer membrane usher protein
MANRTLYGTSLLLICAVSADAALADGARKVPPASPPAAKPYSIKDVVVRTGPGSPISPPKANWQQPLKVIFTNPPVPVRLQFDKPTIGASPGPTAEQKPAPQVPKATTSTAPAPPPEGADRPIPRVTIAAQAPQVDAEKINVWGREITISVPVREGNRFYGNLPLRISVDDVLELPVDQLAAALGEAITPEARAALMSAGVSSGQIRLERLAQAGLEGKFDPQRGEIVVSRSGTVRPLTDIAMSNNDIPEIGNFEAQGKFSAFVTTRAGLGWELTGPGRGFDGLDTSVTFGANLLNVVFESEVTGTFNSEESRFQRSFSRFVYDRPSKRERWSVGDVSVASLGYMGGPSLLGLQVTSDRNLFDPNRNLRPTSFETFSVSQQSQVDILVNGRVERQLTLDPGQYRLTDFQFSSGANEVQIVATDRTGRQQVSRFNRFYDFSLLPAGEINYDLTLGLTSQPTLSGPSYSSDSWIASGIYRRGINEQLTLGAGFQSDRYTQVASLEGAASRKWGTISFAAGLSNDSRSALGYAGRFTFQRQFNREAKRRLISGWTLGGEVFSEDFSGVGREIATPNSNAWSLFGSSTFDISPTQFGNLTFSYQQPRNNLDPTYSAQASYGFRLTNDLFLNFQTIYQASQSQRGQLGFGLNLSFRFGANTLVSAGYDTVQKNYDVGFSQINNRNVGSGALNGRLSGSAQGLGLTVGNNGSTNRFDYGFNQSANYNFDTREIDSATTSLTGSFSVGFVDGSMAIGRPIADSFAIVRAHPILKAAAVEIDAREGSFRTKSGALGPALLGDLNAYTPRVFTVSAPDAPIGFDLGASSYRVRPTYRSGYSFVVGSDYVVTALGTLLDERGQAIPLSLGKAQLAAGGDGRQVEFFTNAKGQFGISGLKPGKWLVQTTGEKAVKFEFVIPEGAEGLVRLGTIEGKP